ncbi:MAG: DUF427 domain-containing protein [Gammaproteobacteria bacterium]|nr:DUF427 domain-containing protein [Gammaproteobacteria bacterium]
MNEKITDTLWEKTGQSRPEFAVDPGPGQESVWDYPRPPIGRRDNRLIEVRDGDNVIGRTNVSYKIMETASPPTFYIPPDDINWDLLVATRGGSVCEWKGAAAYWALAKNPTAALAWSYPRPRPRFDAIKDALAFYPGRIACYVDGERVEPQAGRFYGGWITSDVVGPFKGEPGTGHW